MAWLRNRLLLVIACSVAGLWLVGPDAPSWRRIMLAAAPDQAPAWHAALTGRDESGPVPTAPHARVAQATSSGGHLQVPSPAVVRTDAEPAPSASRTDDATRKLARSIQVELKRVGCYDGEVDGAWTATTRRAMQEFNRRVRASLATERPDYILLTLLQGHAARACGNVCPLGQVAGPDGACQSRALQADARKGAQDSDPAPWARAIAEAVASSRQAGGAVDRERPGLATRDARQQSERAAASGNSDPRRLADEASSRPGAADALAQRKVAAEKALAEAERARAAAAAERARIAALEERKRQQAAMAQSHAEAERARRLAEAETARIEAEARRRAELIALAARAVEPRAAPLRPALPAGASALGGPVEGRSASTPGMRPTARPVDPPRPPAGASIAAIATDAPAAEPRTEGAPEGVAAASPPAKPRFVAPFVPPAASRVGRLPPRPRLAPTVRVVQRPPAVYRYTAAPNVQSIFLRTQRGSP